MAAGPLRGMKRAAAWLAGLLVLLIVMTGGVAWLAVGTETGLCKIAKTAASFSGGRLVLQGCRGNLLHQPGFERLVWDDAQRQAEVRGLRLDWRPAALLDGMLEFHQVTADLVRVENKMASVEPPAAPDSLRLPLDIRLTVLDVGRLEFANAEGALLGLRGLRGEASYLGGQYRARLEVHHEGSGDWTASAQMGDGPPFALQGSGTLEGTRAAGVEAHLGVTGSLVSPAIEARASGTGWTATGSARLAPFSARAVTSAALRSERFNLADLREGLPRTALDVTLEAVSTDDGELGGKVSLENALAGPVDAGRLPVGRMSVGFRLAADGISLSDLRLRGDAGELAGEGALRQGRLSLALDVSRLNLRAIHGAMVATGLSGPLRVSAMEEGQALNLDLRQPGWRVVASGSHQDGVMQLGTASIESPGGRVAGTGSYHSEDGRFQAQARLQGVDPARFGPWPQARLNGRLQVAGEARPDWFSEVSLQIEDSQWRGQMLSADLEAKVSAARGEIRTLQARLGSVRMRGRGALGRADDQLDFQISAPDLQVLAPGWRGRLEAGGHLTGRFDAPGLALEVEGSALALGASLQVERAQATANLEAGPRGVLKLDADATNVRTAGGMIERLQVAAQGRRDAHDASLELRSGAQTLRASARGGWRTVDGWAGQLSELVLAGPVRAQLRAPSPLALDRDRVAVGPASLSLAEGSLELDRLDWADGQLRTAGTLSRLPLAALPLGLERHGLRTDMVFSGEWRLDLGDRAVGQVRLARESGDLAVTGVRQDIPLGVRELSARATLDDGRVVAVLKAQGDTLGAVDLSLGTRLVRAGPGWTLPATAPLRLAASAGMPSLAWTRLVLPPDIQLAGALGLQVAGDGTLATPRLSGEIRGAGLQLEMIEEGLALREGLLAARFEGDRVVVDELGFRGGDGTLKLSGTLALPGGDPRAALTVQARRLTALSRPDRLLVLGGDGRISLENRQLAAMGDFTVERGLWELSRLENLTESNDVRVKGKTGAAPGERALAARVDLGVDMGDAFRLRGYGLDTRLAGRLRIQSEPGRLPVAKGSIRALEGTYKAYGQNLTVDRGSLTFNGALDNPAIDVVALRKGLSVEAGVAVTGSAQSPRVQLVSEPTVPDADKLAWMTLGHGLDAASSNEYGAMQVAAAALLSQSKGAGLQGKIAEAVGLDDLSVGRGGTLEGTVVSFGKRLARNVYLVYERSLAGTANLVRIQYELSRRWSVQARAGAETAIDLFYTLGVQ